MIECTHIEQDSCLARAGRTEPWQPRWGPQPQRPERGRSRALDLFVGCGRMEWMAEGDDWSEARRRFPRGGHFPGRVSDVPWGAGRTGLFVDLSAPPTGFVDILFLRRIRANGLWSDPRACSKSPSTGGGRSGSFRWTPR